MGSNKGDSMWVRSKGRVGVFRVGIRRWGASKGEIEREKGELTPKRDYGET